MRIPLLSRLFRGTSEPGSEAESIVLADFDLEPARTIKVTPAKEAVPEELGSVVEKLAAGMVEAWNGAVREMQAILATDHAKLEAAAAEMHQVTDQLGRVSEELTLIRRRVAALEESVDDVRKTGQASRERMDAQAGLLRELHSATEAQAARVRGVVAAVKKFGEALAE
jgi:septal ring factor EnvC (AmiA/AmiB activator)